MSDACPLNFKRVEDNISRIGALFVSSLVILYLYSLNIYILIFLFFDFIIKLFLDRDMAPITLVAKFFKSACNIKDKFVDGGAKRLAGFFGLLFISLLLVTHLFNFWSSSLIIAMIFLSCTFMDAFFSFCIGCKVYFIVKKIYPNFMNNL